MESPKSETTMKEDPNDCEVSDQSRSEIDSTTQSAGHCAKGREPDDSYEEIGTKLSQLASKRVYQTRFVVLLILSIASVGISLVVYHVCDRAEHNQFDSQFDGAADKVLEEFSALPMQIGSISAIGIMATIQGMNSREKNSKSWPFVTFPSFEHRAAVAVELSGSMTIVIHPLVSDDHRDEYETFSTIAGRAYMYVS
jgi:hypothetical protein